jgi:hypothetical protein
MVCWYGNCEHLLLLLFLAHFVAVNLLLTLGVPFSYSGFYSKRAEITEGEATLHIQGSTVQLYALYFLFIYF